jgi:uncharacterized protein with GYD domain
VEVVPETCAQKGGEQSMPMYVGLVNWTDQGARNAKESVKRLDAFATVAEKMECKVLNTVYTMGPHDIVTIFEAPNDRVASALVLSVGSLGNVRTVTMPAYTKDEMASILRELP